MCAIVMYSCGLRISEALNLKVSDIDSWPMVLIVRGKVPPHAGWLLGDQ